MVEKLTGRDYYDHVRETIFRPLGMKDTDFYRVDEVVPNLAIGYTRDLERPGAWRNNLLVTGVRGGRPAEAIRPSTTCWPSPTPCGRTG